tara:strand:+ start:34 stop:669 length:636 start_codon:yes stop_codon:yes gene_type:complete
MHLVSNITNGPIPVSLTKNNHPSFIGSYILSDLTICDKLIDYLNDPLGNSGEGKVKAGGTFNNVVNKKAKDSIDRGLGNDPISCEYSMQLQQCLDCYLEEYTSANRVDAFLDNIEYGNVQKYPMGGAYHAWHSERSGLSTCRRHLVYMTYLNDVFDGGETEFFYQKIKIKPKKGLTIIWPSDWTHTHRGLPSTTEIKYIVTGWYCFRDNNL